MKFSSTPTISEFNPNEIPFQMRVIDDIRDEFDYTKGVHEILCSGSLGSSKTLLAAHLCVIHALRFPGAVVGIGRKTLPSLRDTLLNVILAHLDDDVQYSLNQTKGQITFSNGSKIMPFSWADGNYKKIRSYEFSAFAIEELTENDDQEFYDEIRMRMGRLTHVPECWLLSITNPDSPENWAYKYFIESKEPTRHVYYSNTMENPFLPDSYIKQLQEQLDERMARRMLQGEWLEIADEVVYYSYDKAYNYVDGAYSINTRDNIHISFDFNIAANKPMSAVFFQRDGQGTYHFYDEVVIQSARTEDVLEEAYARGLFDGPQKVIVNGDASGRHRDTRSKGSDYDIIQRFLSNTRNNLGRVIHYEVDVPRSNPAIRARHNKVNAMCCNSIGQRKVKVYEAAPMADQGLRLTKLKKGGQYIEDDSKPWQHITTAIGYGIWAAEEYYRPNQSGGMLDR